MGSSTLEVLNGELCASEYKPSETIASSVTHTSHYMLEVGVNPLANFWICAK